jgi:hypothetical protein
MPLIKNSKELNERVSEVLIKALAIKEGQRNFEKQKEEMRQYIQDHLVKDISMEDYIEVLFGL